MAYGRNSYLVMAVAILMPNIMSTITTITEVWSLSSYAIIKMHLARSSYMVNAHLLIIDDITILLSLNNPINYFLITLLATREDDDNSAIFLKVVLKISTILYIENKNLPVSHSK